jgi:alanyl-tRNA synthetase
MSYLDDPSILEFEANIRQKYLLPDGRIGVILDRTYFYPTGGGQECDTGTLGKARVIEVFKDEKEPVVVHVVDQDINPGPVIAHIDPERRQRAMQHHTAQHLLSQCFVELFDLDTISAHINGYSSSTIDLPLANLQKDDLKHVEDLANQIIFEDRRVKTYFISPDQLYTIPLRKAPKVSENIRIVEIETFDYSACGGTHLTSTGSIGMVKVTKTERVNDKTRIHFIAGLQALQVFREYQDIVTGLAAQLSVHPSELEPTVQRQALLLKSQQRELHVLRLERCTLEAQKLSENAETLGKNCLILAVFEDRPLDELRALANELRKMPTMIALLASFYGQKISLIVVCGQDSGLNAREILNLQLATIGGRSGGDALLAQGGGSASEAQFKMFFAATKQAITETLNHISSE